MNYLRVENGDNEGIYLTAGYGTTRGGGLASFYDASLTFHVGANLVAAMTGTSFLVGNGAESAGNHAMWEGAAMAVFGDTDTEPASINLISTGTNKNNNLINFREGSSLGGTDNTWTVGQNIGSSTSDLVVSYTTGVRTPALTGTDVVATFSPEGFEVVGTGAAASNDFVVSGSQVGVGTVPQEGAVLDVVSTTAAFMPPRMTTAQRNAIPSPAAGMVIYNTTTNVLDFHNGTVWGDI